MKISLPYRKRNRERFCLSNGGVSLIDQINAPGCTVSSCNTRLEKHSFEGYPYKTGVKLVVNPFVEGEPHVEAGGGADLYGICIDIDDFTQTATVMPLTGNTFQGFLLANNSKIKGGDRLFF
ncbi:DUF228 domain-containing protein [Borrelia miyamotoi]|uniref:DUF228 domain-containing protein n=1 Tax=Borrelia miyamotoi TaxID=47466 RepID=UPI0031FEC978